MPKRFLVLGLVALTMLCLAGRRRAPIDPETEYVHKVSATAIVDGVEVPNACPQEGWTMHPAVVKQGALGVYTLLFDPIAQEKEHFLVSKRADGRLALCCMEPADTPEVACSGFGGIQHEPHGSWFRVRGEAAVFPGDLTQP